MADFLTVGLTAVREAEKILLRYHKSDLAEETKEDNSPVTKADKEAEQAIISIIKKSFPEHGFIGEEFGEQNSQARYKWIIDPLDGTENFIREMPFFGTLLALQDGEEIIMGISNIPLMKELLHAEQGKGAFLNGTKVQVSATNKLQDAMLVYGSHHYFLQKKISEKFLSLLAATQRSRGYGDLFMYHLLASGRCDITAEARVRYWDIAPFKVIIEEAGGRITGLQGNPVERSTTTCLASNGTLHEDALRYFKR